MSDEIGDVAGTHEAQGPSTLYVGSFFGGKRGRCMQITLSTRLDYIQLDRKGVLKLRRLINKFLEPA